MNIEYKTLHLISFSIKIIYNNKLIFYLALYYTLLSITIILYK